MQVCWKYIRKKLSKTKTKTKHTTKNLQTLIDFGVHRWKKNIWKPVTVEPTTSKTNIFNHDINVYSGYVHELLYPLSDTLRSLKIGLYCWKRFLPALDKEIIFLRDPFKDRPRSV